MSGDYVSKAGLKKAPMAKYVREQERQDQRGDRIRSKGTRILIGLGHICCYEGGLD